MLRRYPSWLFWMMSLVIATPPSIAAAQAPAGGTATDSALDLSLLSPGTFAAVVVHPHRVIHAPAMDFLPREVIAAASVQRTAVDATTIERVVAFAEPPRDGAGPEAGVLFQFAQPYDAAKFQQMLPIPAEEVEVEGKPCLRLALELPVPVTLYMADNKTMLFGTPQVVGRAIRGGEVAADNEVVRILSSQAAANDATLVVSLDAIREHVNAALQQAPELPPHLARFKQAPDLVSTLAARINLTNSRPTGVALLCKDEADAGQLDELISQGLDMARQAFLAQIEQKAARAGDEPVQQAMAAYMRRVSEKMFDPLRPVREGNRLILEGRSNATAQVNAATIGILVALLLPAVQAAREAARRAQASNDLKQIALALHNYHAAQNAFPPPAITDKDGKPLLSWRVAILPYLEQQQLYEQFRLDEPWDSEHNRQLASAVVPVYQGTNPGVRPGMTAYLGAAGKGTIFEGPKGTRIDQIRDGTANTIMVVEANPDQAVPWTSPADLEFEPGKPLRGLGAARPGGFNAAFADGSVRFLSKSIDGKLLGLLMQMADGQPITGDF